MNLQAGLFVYGQEVAMRTNEEAKMANYTTLLTSKAKEEAEEYLRLHRTRAAMMHVNLMETQPEQYQPGTLRGSYKEAYDKQGISGMLEIMEKRNFIPITVAGGVGGGTSADDVLKLQAEVVEGVKKAGQKTVKTALTGPGLDDIREAMMMARENDGQAIAEGVTESVSFARKTLNQIIEGSELAARVMRFRT